MKLQIEKPVYGGAGLAHQTEGSDAGKAVFVPFTLPGEIVEAHLLEPKNEQKNEQKNDFAEASLVQVLTASKDRVQPRCAHFGQCGGCQYQHAAYPTQLQMKSAILLETLERAGLDTLPGIQKHAGEPWGYRNRARLRISELETTVRAGYNRRGSNEFLPIHECPILSPLLWRTVETLLQLAAKDSVAARWLRATAEVEIFTTADETKIQIAFFIRKKQTGFDVLCKQLRQLLPELTGAGVSLLTNAVTQRRSQNPHPLESWGADGLSYRAIGEDYWVSRGGFFQVNRFLVEELVRIVTAERKGLLAWDLYAGVGLFSRALTKSFQKVVAVEADANDLSNSFKGPGRHAVEATTADFLRSAVVQRERPQLIVMDPPRAGVGAEVCELLTRLSVPEIIYVSCDPVTLARDLKPLKAAGYAVVELHMVDMFPQTFHLETVVVLRRGS
jgi:23S rRNA (uracil1939-C5)-methyltransferase